MPVALKGKCQIRNRQQQEEPKHTKKNDAVLVCPRNRIVIEAARIVGDQRTVLSQQSGQPCPTREWRTQTSFTTSSHLNNQARPDTKTPVEHSEGSPGPR